MIFPDRKEAKRVADGKVTAILRPASARTPFTTADQPIEWRRPARDEDPANLRDRQANTDEPVAREAEGDLEIVAQTATTLGELTNADAKALGHGNLAGLRAWVNQQWGHETDDLCRLAWRPNRPVWLIRFVLVVQREDQPTWLAHRRGVTHDRSRALDELECVDRPTQRVITAKATGDFKLLKAEEHLKARAKSLGRRVREDTIATVRAGVDIDDELAQIEHQLERIRRKREGLDQAA